MNLANHASSGSLIKWHRPEDRDACIAEMLSKTPPHVTSRPEYQNGRPPTQLTAHAAWVHPASLVALADTGRTTMDAVNANPTEFFGMPWRSFQGSVELFWQLMA